MGNEMNHLSVQCLSVLFSLVEVAKMIHYSAGNHVEFQSLEDELGKDQLEGEI
jgi:hypothetical protein